MGHEVHPAWGPKSPDCPHQELMGRREGGGGRGRGRGRGEAQARASQWAVVWAGPGAAVRQAPPPARGDLRGGGGGERAGLRRRFGGRASAVGTAAAWSLRLGRRVRRAGGG